jgi:helix-turn-helix protein
VVSKPSLNLANHKRNPHDPRTIDCGVPIRDVCATRETGEHCGSLQVTNNVRKSLWKHRIRFDIDCAHRGRSGHHIDPRWLPPLSCREGVDGSCAMNLPIGSHARPSPLDLNQKDHPARSRSCISDLAFPEIALALGFSRTSSFSAAFRKITGISPTEYRLTLALAIFATRCRWLVNIPNANAVASTPASPTLTRRSPRCL